MDNIKEILGKLEGVELTDEQIAQVEKDVLANYRTKAELDNKAQALAAAEATNKQLTEELEAAKNLDASNTSEVEAMKARLDEMIAEQNAAKEKSEAEAKREAFKGAFAEALGGKRFANKIVGDTVFEKAYTMSSENPAMAVDAIVSQIVGDEPGIWLNPQQDPKKMPTPGNDNAGVGATPITSVDQIKGMTPDEINANWATVSELLKNNR